MCNCRESRNRGCGVAKMMIGEIVEFVDKGPPDTPQWSMAPKGKTSAPRKPMSTGHKAALARGRAESATVRHYLEALETSKPRRGRKRTAASIDKRLGTIDSQLAGADALTRLHLLQEQKDLLDERSRVDQVKDMSALEKEFIKVAKAYGERKGITYSTWRAAGVSATVLQKADVSRARS